MKKIISFEKEINFPGMIGDITSISLDHTLKFVDSNSIRGDFTISGTYKMTEASTLEEKFSYDIPAEIDLVEKIDLSTSKISIDNFTYEIVNDDILKNNIDVLIEGVEEIEVDTDTNVDDNVEVDDNSLRECDGDKSSEKEIEIPTKEETKEIEVLTDEDILENTDEKQEIEDKEELSEDTTNIGSLFASLEYAEETFTTYSVYIFRKDDTLEKVLDKYKISKEELSEYNDLDNLEIGTKLIIPSIDE